jgi:hypothetical protein
MHSSLSPLDTRDDLSPVNKGLQIHTQPRAADRSTLHQRIESVYIFPSAVSFLKIKLLGVCYLIFCLRRRPAGDI